MQGPLSPHPRVTAFEPGRTPLGPGSPTLQRYPWAASEDFTRFDREADGLMAADHRRPMAGEASSGAFVDDAGQHPSVYFTAQARSSPGAQQQKQAPGPSEKMKLFQRYIKESYNLTDEEAGRAMKDYSGWVATRPWVVLPLLGATKNVNGQISPAQDRLFRAGAESFKDPALKEKAKRGYDDALKSGKMKIVDDPTKP